jgi:hypothetical protein
MDVAPHDIVHESVTRCTAAGIALHERYVITNIGELDEEEIATFLKERTTEIERSDWTSETHGSDINRS